MSWPTRVAATSTTCSPTIDKFAYEKSMLINVGDEKGELLDAAVRRADPAWRWSWAPTAATARCGSPARRRRPRCSPSSSRRPTPKWRGASGRTPASTTGSPAWSAPSATAAGRSTRWPTSTASAPGTLDLLFIDHDKGAYLPDLQSILDRGWLHRGSIVVADNVRIPGAPKYREYMREQQGKLSNTVEHKTHCEYQTLVARSGAGVGVPRRLTARGRSASPCAWTAWPCSR